MYYLHMKLTIELTFLQFQFVRDDWLDLKKLKMNLITCTTKVSMAMNRIKFSFKISEERMMEVMLQSLKLRSQEEMCD